jgi:MoaA/NifB/PqqE/SkfB family radical SAM enzyme
MSNPEGRNEPLLRYLIYFVTGRCNARCAMCFYWEEMDNAAPDLSLDEVRRIADKLGPLETLLLSGGEPTLRNDLPALVETFHGRNGVRHVGLPVNGLMPERTRDLVDEILKRCPKTRLEVNLSIDDLGEHHDAIRGVPGAFDCLLRTAELVGALRERHENLFLNVETVLFSRNWRRIPEILDYVYEQLDANGHYVEVMRGTPRDSSLTLPTFPEIRRIHRLVLKNHERYHRDPRKKRWSHELPYLRELYRWQERALRGAQWPAACPAGADVAVLEPDGRVRGCELRGVIGDLRACDYDMGRVLESAAAQAERRDVRDSHCSCTHCVFIYQTFAVHSLPSERRRRWVERWYALRRRLAGEPQ